MKIDTNGVSCISKFNYGYINNLN